MSNYCDYNKSMLPADILLVWPVEPFTILNYMIRVFYLFKRNHLEAYIYSVNSIFFT